MRLLHNPMKITNCCNVYNKDFLNSPKMTLGSTILNQEVYENGVENSKISMSLNLLRSYYLRTKLLDIDDKVRFVIPLMLDKVSVALEPWSGYYVLAKYQGT